MVTKLGLRGASLADGHGLRLVTGTIVHAAKLPGRLRGTAAAAVVRLVTMLPHSPLIGILLTGTIGLNAEALVKAGAPPWLALPRLASIVGATAGMAVPELKLGHPADGTWIVSRWPSPLLTVPLLSMVHGLQSLLVPRRCPAWTLKSQAARRLYPVHPWGMPL